MISNYYIPNKEDLFRGYECQIYIGSTEENPYPLSDPKHLDFGWHFHIIKELYPAIPLRTQYLSQEQIVAEGWRQIHYREYLKELPGRCIHFFNGNREDEDDSGHFSSFTLHNGKKTYYEGDCPSINEFRKICKLIGI